MKGLKQKFQNFFFKEKKEKFPLALKYWPLLAIFVIVGVFFKEVIFFNKIPIPSDFIVGVYYPWLDYKWVGYLAGVPVKNPLLADIPSLIYPVREYSMRLLFNDILPLWNPLQFGGYPLLATFQPATLYPLNIIYYFLDTVNGWTLQVMLQPTMAILFTYLFLRHLKATRLASLLGGVVYAFSGFNIIWMEYNVHGHAAALIPLILLSIDKIIKQEKFFWSYVLSLSLAAQILAGYPQLVAYTVFLAVFWFIFRVDKSSSKTSMRLALRVGFYCALGILITSAQLIPGAELLFYSQRIKEGVSGGFGIAFLPWEHLVSIFAPDYFGNPATGNYWGRWNFAGYANVNIYAGTAAFILATLALSRSKEKRLPLFFVGVLIASLFFALPTPVTTFLFSTEFLGLKSAAATRILVLSNFSIATLAGLGLDRLTKEKLESLIRSTYLPWVVLGATFLGTFAAWLILGGQPGMLLAIENGVGVGGKMLKNLSIGLRNLALPFLITAAVSVILILSHKAKSLIALWKGVLFLVVAAELFRFGWKFTPFARREFLFPKTPVFEFLARQEKPFRMVGGDVLPISMWMPYNLESPSGYDAVYPARWAKLIAVINSGDLNATPMGRYGAVEGYGSRLFDLTNTKYVLALKRDPKNAPDSEGVISTIFDLENLVPVFEDKTVVVLENKKALPRTFFVSRWETSEEDEILRKLLDPGFPIREKIILEEDFSKFRQTAKGEGEVRYLDYKNQKSRIEVKAQSDGFLFVSDSWYPGWKAFVDGRQERIYRANYTFRAVPVTKGQHVVEFVYRPDSFFNGVKISAASLVLLLLTPYFGKRILGKRKWRDYT